MRRRIMTTALAAMFATALLAGPAAAHVNDAIPANKGTAKAAERQGGTPFPGFIGPVEGFVGSEIYVRAHSGMECGALRSPRITALGPAGINFDSRFICPAEARR
jgi:hypothetical protein